MKNQEIARIFNDIADRLELKEENPFRIRAYRKAALNIEGLSKNVEEIPEAELRKIPGIGQDLAGKIVEYCRTGKIQAYEELKSELPEGLLRLLAIPSLGPKTAKQLYDTLQVKSIDELEKLALEHKLSKLPGIKEKTEENILKGIQTLKRGTERQPIGKVLPLAHAMRDQLRAKAPVGRIDIAGSIRRWKDTVKDIDILVTSDNPDKAMDVFVYLPQVREILVQGPTKSSVITHEGIQVDVRVVEEESYGAALTYFTGSKTHNIRLREMAVKKGLKINEYGIFREKDNKRIGGEEEGDVYRILGLPYIPPELREDQGEVEAALEGRLPDLITIGDIQGDLHVHSKWSDGSHTFEEVVEAARERGYSYIALTDHSRGLAVARGLTIERLMEQKKEIAALNRKLRGFRVLQGTEVDIRSDGSLDFPDEVLKELDIVVASIHSGFKQSAQQLTSRIVSAMRNPYVSIIAHPTGRLIGDRDAYELDMEEILRVAAETGTALEINASPFRLDLSDAHARKAKERGIPLVISTDTHVVDQFTYMGYGVSIARRGWVGKGDVLNTLEGDALLRRLKPGKKGTT
ncbi:MAG: DNA polymerase/3'-5' exonuclease PolX [Alphaproteobacteria bacterium]|uniref:DNA polymerase beta n=1 Tax=Candidatus Nitrobium versatile TaxID=2884831 RepID=A0A953JGM3_9BACT|nr:DNA polymerase/3'-5' exonuclease PolX [Candidatus Nitrobium versatile]